MIGPVVALVLAAALLHATWNALLKSRSDRLRSMMAMSFATTAAALPFAALMVPPASASWPYLGVSTVLQVGYSLVLVAAYRDGDFGQVYPIARGSAPLLVTIGAALFAGEAPGPLMLAGISLVAGGILSLALVRDAWRSRALGNALATGLFIASYSVCDGIGSRLSGAPLSYAAWIFLAYGVAFPATVLAMRGRSALGFAGAETAKALGGGVISLVAYSCVIWAVTLTPMGAVSALRETSILFAALIGRAWFGETLTPRRVGACLAIALGAICLGVA